MIFYFSQQFECQNAAYKGKLTFPLKKTRSLERSNYEEFFSTIKTKVVWLGELSCFNRLLSHGFKDTESRYVDVMAPTILRLGWSMPHGTDHI